MTLYKAQRRSVSMPALTVVADVPLVAAVEAVAHAVAEVIDGHAAELPVLRRRAPRPRAPALEVFFTCNIYYVGFVHL